MKNRALLLCVLAAPGLALPQTVMSGTWRHSGRHRPDYHRDVDHNGMAYGAAFGRELGPMFNIELSGNATDQRPHLGTAARRVT